MKFFIDASISSNLIKALKIIALSHGDYEIKHLTDRFERNIKDEEWIQKLSTDGDWIIISADPRITKGKAEKRAWQESGLSAFFFSGGWASNNVWKQAEDLFRWWPKIFQKARECENGSGYCMPQNARDFKFIYPLEKD